jgi:hypothetical protein
MPTYIWVVDDTTKHAYDVDERCLRPGMTPVKGYPPNFGPSARPRRPKHFVAKDGRPAAPRTAAAPTTPADPATTPPEGTDQS